MIPGNRLVLLLVTLGVASTALFAFPGLAAGWYGLAAAAACAVLVDGWLALRMRAPTIERQLSHSLSLESWADITLTVRNRDSARLLTLLAYDHHPETFDAPALPVRVEVPGRQSASFTYRAKPLQRGPARFTGCALRLASPLGLWWRRRFVAHDSLVRVYPDFAPISKLLAYEVDSRLQLSGVRLSRRRGAGIEFHQLRDYRDGDALRSVDWKATSRIGRLIAREYQDERDQHLVFLLDAGRNMLARDDTVSHFDHTLNAMLLVAYVALRHGDAVGVMTAGASRSWLPPQKGANAINGILNHVYEIEPAPIEIDYVAAATELAVRQRRRSMVVILTNVRDVDTAELRIATNLLRRRHVVLLASLRERALDDALQRDIRDFDDALLHSATHRYLDAREEAHRLLRAGGVHVVDCFSSALPAEISNQYLAIKRAGIL